MTPTKSTFPQSVLEWLRAGYPEGVPPKDRIPLVALLHRRLTPEEIKDVAVALTDAAGQEEDATIARDRIGDLIGEVTDAEPSAEDITRVEAVLVSAGWSLADHAGVADPGSEP
ncbi:DUF3349 domain-containing protein [Rhodococcus sp. NPDC003318]|uniref:DUF3349 domain-containing protein n=1 Tax=Rhodococcus sp. NPDC003318 TaxID=3364503 RepID=UPI0036C7F887